MLDGNDNDDDDDDVQYFFVLAVFESDNVHHNLHMSVSRREEQYIRMRMVGENEEGERGTNTNAGLG